MCRYGDPVREVAFKILMLLIFLVVPLYWTQHGYGLKPPPVLSTDRTAEQNMDALKRHFQRTVPVYGLHVSAPIVPRLLVSLKLLGYPDHH